MQNEISMKSLLSNYTLGKDNEIMKVEICQFRHLKMPKSTVIHLVWEGIALISPIRVMLLNSINNKIVQL